MEEPYDYPELSLSQAIVMISVVTGITVLNSIGNGLLTVGLPTIAADLGLNDDLVLWPASVYSLACGCFLLFNGQLSDLIGSKRVFVAGCATYAIFTLACGLANTPLQLIIFRALQGIAIAACLPSAVGILSRSLAPGTNRRNLAFAVLGAGQPMGFAVGLVLSGLILRSLSWRWTFFISSMINAVVVLAGIFSLPKDKIGKIKVMEVINSLDIVGGILICTSLGMFFYVLAVTTANSALWRSPVNIALISISVACIPILVWWDYRREKQEKAVILPLKIWKNVAFVSICITVFLVWSAFNGIQFFATLWFQNIQGLSPLETSIRFIPMVISGTLANLSTGLLVSRISGNHLTLVGVVLTFAAPLLFAFGDPDSTYWKYAFPAMCLVPIGADILFPISNLAITNIFPQKTQALAGATFNTVAQMGNSIGLAVSSIVAASISRQAHNETAKMALLKGYRASFLTCFGISVLSSFVIIGGMRRIGKVGLKND